MGLLGGGRNEEKGGADALMGGACGIVAKVERSWLLLMCM